MQHFTFNKIKRFYTINVQTRSEVIHFIPLLQQITYLKGSVEPLGHVFGRQSPLDLQSPLLTWLKGSSKAPVKLKGKRSLLQQTLGGFGAPGEGGALLIFISSASNAAPRRPARRDGTGRLGSSSPVPSSAVTKTNFKENGRGAAGRGEQTHGVLAGPGAAC